MDNTPSKKFKDFDWKQLEEDMSLYEEYLLKRKRAIELQMQEARALEEQYKFAMPKSSSNNNLERS